MNTLREQLIQEAETALYATETVTDDMASATIAERHMAIVMERLLAFIKGQKVAAYVGFTAQGDIAYSQSEPVDDLTAVYTDPETLP